MPREDDGGRAKSAPYEGATPDQLDHPLVQDFLSIHDMFRSELVSMLDFVESLASHRHSLGEAETAARIQLLVRAGARYTQHLHLHHSIESSALFPALTSEGLANDVVKRLEAEHVEIGELVDRFGSVVRDATDSSTARIRDSLSRLADALRSHLAYEETHVCPLLCRFTHWPFAQRSQGRADRR